MAGKARSNLSLVYLIYKVYKLTIMDVLYKLRDQQFVWDATKASANLAKHGVSFETALRGVL